MYVLVLAVLSSGRGGSQVTLSVVWKDADASMRERVSDVLNIGGTVAAAERVARLCRRWQCGVSTVFG